MTTGVNSGDKGEIVVTGTYQDRNCPTPTHDSGITALRDKQIMNRCKGFKVKRQSFKCDSILVKGKVSSYPQMYPI